MDYDRLTWVLQEQALAWSDFDALARSVVGLGCRLELVQVVPFSHDPVGRLPQVEGPCIAYGSSGLLSLAGKAGWTPAGWDGASFDATAANRALGPFSLNHGAVVTIFSQVANVARDSGWEKVFVRPNAETKEFAGEVFSAADLQRWVKRLRSAGYFDAEDNSALVAPYRQLGREWRVFVVDEEIVSFCQYADRGEPSKTAGGPCDVPEFARQVSDIYRPAPCFVVDIAEVHSEGHRQLQVVEFNSINSAGWYACDIDEIVLSLSAFVLSDLAPHFGSVPTIS